MSIKFFGIDISNGALKIAKQNAKKHRVDEKIKFIKSDLLNYFFNHQSLLNKNLIIIANLPYLSKKIYSSTKPDVKNFEPSSALVSGKNGLDHYEKLFQQLNTFHVPRSTLRVLLEFSPEQKPLIDKLIKKYFPQSKPRFQKDLAGKWRVAMFEI
jgi:release factor glutamine methyltransferase